MTCPKCKQGTVKLSVLNYYYCDRFPLCSWESEYYPSTLGRELKNSFLHLLVGMIVCFTLIPTLSFYWMLLGAGIYGALREFFQWLRKKKQKPYIILIDVLGIALGSGIWYLIREIFQINVDLL